MVQTMIRIAGPFTLAVPWAGLSGPGNRLNHAAYGWQRHCPPRIVPSLALFRRGFVIRISLGNMPSLLREIVASALSSQSDFALEASGKSECDVLVLCPDSNDNLAIALGEAARLAPPMIVALDPEGELATIVDIAASQQALNTYGDLGGVIRRAAAIRSTF